jgi:hypothetical protein
MLIRFNVRFGSEADIRAAKSHVCFASESGHVQCTRPRLLWAKSGHSSRQWMRDENHSFNDCVGNIEQVMQRFCGFRIDYKLEFRGQEDW